MTDYEQLAAEIRQKRIYQEAEDGTVFCSIRDCPGSTGLRCYRTSVPICKKCSVKTPVGYISREAAREQQDRFFDMETGDYIVAGVTAFFANLFIGFFVTRIGFFLPGFLGLIILFFVATSAAGVISEIIRQAIQKKRGRYISQVITIGLIFSSIILFFLSPPLTLIIYALIVFTTVNARFQMGIRL
ncbi:MAG: hypothetical protein ACLFTK_16740 [Anaerolineales bacterium]